MRLRTRLRRVDADGGTTFGRTLRLQLAREHLDLTGAESSDLTDPYEMFDAYRNGAAALDAWHASADGSRRPPGRLRPYELPPLGRVGRIVATAMFRYVCVRTVGRGGCAASIGSGSHPGRSPQDAGMAE
jgi:hypothetical protein